MGDQRHSGEELAGGRSVRAGLTSPTTLLPLPRPQPRLSSWNAGRQPRRRRRAREPNRGVGEGQAPSCPHPAAKQPEGVTNTVWVCDQETLETQDCRNQRRRPLGLLEGGAHDPEGLSFTSQAGLPHHPLPVLTCLACSGHMRCRAAWPGAARRSTLQGSWVALKWTPQGNLERQGGRSQGPRIGVGGGACRPWQPDRVIWDQHGVGGVWVPSLL